MAGKRDIQRRFSRRLQVDMVGEGLLVGLAGGGVVTLYRLSLGKAEEALSIIATAISGSPLLIASWFIALAALGAIVCRLMVWEPYTQGSGIPQIDAEVMGRIDMPWWRVLLAKFVEGTLCALGGLSLGREGPSVQLGGVAGKAVSRLLRRDRGEERLLTTCGAAAGMSAAFNAPLTGTLFAIEEIHREFSGPLLVAVMAATIASDFLVSQVLGVRPVLEFTFTRDLPHGYYPYILALGLFCGFAGALHNQGMFLASRLYGRIRRGAPYTRLAVPFALAGVAVLLWPELTCGGDRIIKLVMAPGVLPLGTIAALLLGKYAFTTLCFGSGAPGGTLFPLCVMGSLCGALFAVAATNCMGLPGIFVTNFIVLGIGGLFASVVRAPVTAVVLAFELTGSLDALLSVSIVSIIAYVTANLLHVDPFYEHLFARLIGAQPVGPRVGGPQKAGGDATACPGGTSSHADEKILQTHVVGAGSQAEGRLVRDVSWPHGARIVIIERAGQEVLPTGDTRLEALDSLVFIISSSDEYAAETDLRKLLRGSLESKRTP